MKIGINTLWLKHKRVGGIESYLFNLLDGILKNDEENYYLLIISEENKSLFYEYSKNKNVEIISCKIESSRVVKRIVLENFNVDNIAKKNNVDVMFNPVYSKPIFTFNKIPYVTTIHDLQALHYPEYFSIVKRKWLKFAWKNSIKTSSKIIAISNFVRDDIIDKFNVKQDKVCTIYNPIKIEKFIDDFSIIKEKYGVDDNSYYYTVSSMHKHKNLITLLKVMKNIKENYPDINKKLIISGISGNAHDEFNKKIKELGIEDIIITTGFIDDSERNILYKHSSIFLFPSIFEGFGMPPIEAMLLGKEVITTEKTSIKEVTKGLVNYVLDPFDEDEWVNKIKICNNGRNFNYDINDYRVEQVANKYVEVFKEVYKKSR